MIKRSAPRERYDITVKLHEVDALIAQGYTICDATRMVGVSATPYQKHRKGIRKSSDAESATQKMAAMYSLPVVLDFEAYKAAFDAHPAVVLDWRRPACKQGWMDADEAKRAWIAGKGLANLEEVYRASISGSEAA